MRQLPLSYDPAHAGVEAWQNELEAIRAAVNHLGVKEVTFKLDVAKSTLSEALNERNEKRWAASWTHVVLAMLASRHTDACDQLAKDIHVAQLATSLRFVVVDASDEPTPEEVAAAERVIAKVRGRKRAA